MSKRNRVLKPRGMRLVGFIIALAVTASGLGLALPGAANAQPVTFRDSHGNDHTIDVTFVGNQPPRIVVDGQPTMNGQAFHANTTTHTRRLQKVVLPDIIVFENNCIFYRGIWISVPPGNPCP